MKTIILSLGLCLLMSGMAFAQVGFNADGTQPDPSAGLDVKFADKGLLIPRVELVETTSASPVTSPALSLLVYNTATANDVTPGYYYWNGTEWVRLSTLGEDHIHTLTLTGDVTGSGDVSGNWATTLSNSGVTAGDYGDATGAVVPYFTVDEKGRVTSAAERSLTPGDIGGWSMSGNAGTIQGTNFIGTTDNKYLSFRTNDLEKIRITTKGTIETYNTGQSVFIGEGAGAADDLYYRRGVFIGHNAGKSNSTGGSNLAIGYTALYSNTTGHSNVAIGTGSLYNGSTGISNTALGNASLYNNQASSNTALGNQTLYNNTTGQNNTAVGYNALVNNTTGHVNTGIGYFALETNINGNMITSLGYNSDVAVNDLTNATAIGANSYVGASNSLVLGSIAGVNGATSSVNVGIGTTTPGERLDVSGGNIRTDQQLISTTATGTSPLSVSSTTLVSNLNADMLDGMNASDFASFSGSTNYIQNQTTVDQVAGFRISGNGIFNGGNVGIGVADPRSVLNIAGGIGIGSGNGISTTHGAKRSFQILTDTYYGGTYDNHSGYLIYSTMPSGWGNATLNFAVSSNWGEYNTSSPTLTLNGSKVGIGTINPTTTLEVNGNTKITRSSSGDPLTIETTGYGAVQDQANLVGEEFGYGDYWQSFTAGVSGNLNSIVVKLYLYTAPYLITGTWVLYHGTGISGTQIASGTYQFDYCALHGPCDLWCVIPIDGTPYLNANEIYTLEMNDSRWMRSETNVYSGGQNNLGGDQAFKTMMMTDFSIANFVVKEDGKVGIGTATPAEKLDVNGAIRVQDFKAREELGFRFYDNNGPGYLKIGNGGHTYITSSNGSSESSTIFTGWVGINNINPSNALEVKGSTLIRDDNTNGFFKIDNAGNTYVTSSNGTSESSTIFTGWVGIGNINPQHTLAVNGSIRAESDIIANGWYYGYFNGGLYKLGIGAGLAAYWTLSDARFKQEVNTIPCALETLTKLRGVTFHWNDEGIKYHTKDIEKNIKSISGKAEDDKKLWDDKRAEEAEKLSKLQMGFIAQEVEQVYPDWVTTDENGYKKINMEHLNALLVNAIKEQQLLIENQNEAIEAQQNQITDLNNMVESLQAQIEGIEEIVGSQSTSTSASLRADRQSTVDDPLQTTND